MNRLGTFTLKVEGHVWGIPTFWRCFLPKPLAQWPFVLFVANDYDHTGRQPAVGALQLQ